MQDGPVNIRFVKSFILTYQNKGAKGRKVYQRDWLAFCLFVRKLVKKYIKDNVCTKKL